jgi:gamma-glutamylaminecyclotransferase
VVVLSASATAEEGVVMKRIFVYGTLMRGFGNHSYYLDGPLATFVREAETEPGYQLVPLGGFPGMLGPVAEWEGSVKGEVFDVDESLIPDIDSLEGHPHWYRRTPIRLAEGEEVETYIYLHPVSRAPIGSGSWREFTGKIEREVLGV